MKKQITLIVLSLLSFTSIAQDIIVKNDKTEIKAKIEELTETTIKYKKWDMLDGPIYNINLNDVFMIMYKNGTKEYIKLRENVTPTLQEKPNVINDSKPTNSNENHKIDEFSGKVIRHEKMVQDGKYYTYKGAQIKKIKQLHKIFVEDGSSEVMQLAASGKVYNSIATVTGGVGAIGLSAALSSSDFPKISQPGLAIGSTVLIGGCFFLAKLAGKEYAKAGLIFNKEGYEPKVSQIHKFEIKPMFASNQMGNHVGLNIRF
jgi:hypothetical protein